ncbi:caspase family protein [Streptomyces sp. NPDC002172]
MRQSAPRFPDGAASAVLIGCGDFDDIDLPAIPAVKSNLTDLHSALTHRTHGILPPEHCRVLADPADHRSVGMALAQAAREAEDLLLVYRTGHGLLDEDGLLHLALSSTDPGHVGFTGVPADLVKRYLGRARARLRVLVLDCCFSGRAVAAMPESGSLLTAQLDLSGTYTLTSTTATAPSHAPPGQRHTAFTAALLDALEQPQPLALDDIHQHIDTVLQGMGLPRPQRRSVNAAGDLALVRGPVQPHAGTPARGRSVSASPPPDPPARSRRDIVQAVLMMAVPFAVIELLGGWRVTLIVAAAIAVFLGLLLLLLLLRRNVHLSAPSQRSPTAAPRCTWARTGASSAGAAVTVWPCRRHQTARCDSSSGCVPETATGRPGPPDRAPGTVLPRRILPFCRARARRGYAIRDLPRSPVSRCRCSNALPSTGGAVQAGPPPLITSALEGPAPCDTPSAMHPPGAGEGRGAGHSLCGVGRAPVAGCRTTRSTARSALYGDRAWAGSRRCGDPVDAGGRAMSRAAWAYRQGPVRRAIAVARRS